MNGVATMLQQYAEAISEPTRGAILVEIDRSGEATPTQLARRLDLPANNIYHHIRVLRRLGVVAEPRAVAGDHYIEKYYRINPDLRAALHLDPDWYRNAGGELTAEDRREQLVSLCFTMATLLRAAARDLQRRDPEELERDMQSNQLVMLGINRLSREQLGFRLERLHAQLAEEDRKFAEDTSPRTDMMLIATIPDMWNAGSPGGDLQSD